MKHMPYEGMLPGEDRREAPSQDESKHERRQGPIEDPGRTPKSAEGGGLEDEERRVPAGEPGRTPGKSEG